MSASEFEAAWERQRAPWVPKPVSGAQPLKGCVSNVTLDTLAWSGVFDHEQLRQMSDSDLLRLPNLGRKKLAEIRKFMLPPSCHDDPLRGIPGMTAQHIQDWQYVWTRSIPGPGDQEEHTERLEVPGGWLYLVRRPGWNMCMCFVPDLTRESGL